MLFIARSEDQRDPPFASQAAQFIELFAVVLELSHVATAKLTPTINIVSEPFP